MARHPIQLLQVAFAVIALALIACAYWPGLAGPFLFDDFANLNDIGAYGPMDDWRSILYYITSGTADPTGRPVAQLSFLIDARDWPAKPWPFKRTNLALHLVNTLLVALVIRRLQLGLARRRPEIALSNWTPLIAAAFWGAHPLFVSTTLYVVQRQTMLATAFVLLAILAWARAVSLHQSRPVAAWTWALFGFGTLTLLAALSKANGLLAPVMTGLLYLSCLRSASSSRAVDKMAVVTLGLPSLLIFVYLVHHGWTHWSAPYLHGRDWTIPERLLSQPRALWSYVLQLGLPRAGGGGIYVDDFQVSRAWFNPTSTLPAVVALLASVVAAVSLRRLFPIVTCAWLFFLAGHLLESSVVALELYFEHRNYLPATLLGWPLAHALLRTGTYSRYRAAFAALLVAALLLLTYQRASVWSNGVMLTRVSATQRTDSIRSQIQEIQLQLQQGHAAAAIMRIRDLQREDPSSVIASINAISIECMGSGQLTAETLARSKTALKTARNWNYGLYTWFENAAASTEIRSCAGFGIPGLRELVAAGLDNPHNKGSRRRRDFLHAMGGVELAAGNARTALDWFNAALEASQDPAYALSQAAALGNAGYPALGVAHIDYFLLLYSTPHLPVRDMASLHKWLLVRTGYYRREIETLRGQMVADSSMHGGQTEESRE